MRPPTWSAAAGLAAAALLLATPPAAAEEYSPLNSPSTYNRPGEAPENQARFLMASLADRQRLSALELEMQTLSVQPSPNQSRVAELDAQVKELRAKVDKMATDMGGYIPALRHRAGDCEKPGDRRRDDFGRGRGSGPGTGRGRNPDGW